MDAGRLAGQQHVVAVDEAHEIQHRRHGQKAVARGSEAPADHLEMLAALP